MRALRNFELIVSCFVVLGLIVTLVYSVRFSAPWDFDIILVQVTLVVTALAGFELNAIFRFRRARVDGGVCAHE